LAIADRRVPIDGIVDCRLTIAVLVALD